MSRQGAAGVPDDKAASMAKGVVTARLRSLCIDCAASVREQQGQIGANSLDLLLQIARWPASLA